MKIYKTDQELLEDLKKIFGDNLIKVTFVQEGKNVENDK